jgi:cytochrome P450
VTAVHRSKEPDPFLYLFFKFIFIHFLKRWSPENKINRNPYSFMAFGMGPRNCVGMRFAMEEMKIAICTMVQKFRFYPIDETPVLRSNSF